MQQYYLPICKECHGHGKKILALIGEVSATGDKAFIISDHCYKCNGLGHERTNNVDELEKYD